MEKGASRDAARTPSRWLVAVMGTLLQIGLGSVYAWSFFQKPLMTDFGWNTTQVMWIFSLAICFLGLAAAWGGVNLPRLGPTKLAVVGGLLYGGGLMGSSLAMRHHSLPLFYVAFGVVGGSG
ncbi:MAG TPA: MFS transporter, partial [Polyangia bacterium]|nr:MFS transporter [Polyangia bacterium]